MHSSNLVIIPEEDNDKTIEQRVEEAMGPHEENGGFWDWYQIGGRWTGVFDGYEPDKDPNNIEVCDLCGGTGDRATFRGEDKKDQHPTGCNGCLGKGKRTVWPTQFKQHDGDIIPVENLTEEHMNHFFRFVFCDGYGVHGGEKWIPFAKEGEEHFHKLPRPTLDWIKENFKEHLAVVVDSHV